MPQTFPVYVVDDDPSIREWIRLLCEELGFACRTFEGGEAFLAAVEDLGPGCILLDMRMPRPNGLDVQTRLATLDGTMPVIAMTGYGDVDVAVQSMRLGAIEFLEKPFSGDVLAEAIEHGFKTLRAQSG